MVQTKEQGKNPQDQINEEELGNLPEKQFREMIAKMIQDFGNRMMHKSRRYKKCLTRT